MNSILDSFKAHLERATIYFLRGEYDKCRDELKGAEVMCKNLEKLNQSNIQEEQGENL